MSELKGYSFAQKAELDALSKRTLAVEVDVDKKVEEGDFDEKMEDLDANDTTHFNRIGNMKKNRVALNNYNDEMTRLTDIDSQRDSTLAGLTATYTTKVSTFEVAEDMRKVNAILSDHDLRLDELEKRTADIHVDLKGRVEEELNKKTDAVLFDQITDAIRTGQTGIAQQIGQIAVASELQDVTDAQNEAIADLVSIPDFTAKISELTGRNQDIEKRLLAVDQFFRLLEMTYKIYDKDEPETQILYTADSNPVLASQLPPVVNVVGYKRIRTGSGWADSLVVKMTSFGYNIFTGDIKLYDFSNNVIGSLTKEDIDPINFTADIPVVGNVASGGFNVDMQNLAGESIQEIPITSQVIATIPDLSNARIVSFSNTILAGDVGGYIETATFVQGAGAVSVSPPLPDGVTATVDGVSKLLIVSGTPTVPVNTTYTITYSNSFSTDSANITLQINGLPGAPTNLTAIPGDGRITITFTPGANNGSPISGYKYSLNGGAYTTQNSTVSGNQIIITGLTNGTPVTIRLRAINGNGEGPESAQIGGTPAGTVSIASSFSRLGNLDIAPRAMNNVSNHVVASNGDIYVIGSFSIIGNVLANRIARWDSVNKTWHALGSGFNNTPIVIALRETTVNNKSIVSDVYVGGGFLEASGMTVNRIARWNTATSTWHALGDGCNDTVNSLGVIGTDVYVGGLFTSAGGVSVNRIARWDTVNSTWHALGTGLSNVVNTITVSGTDVYVGGAFIDAGGVSVNRIARWDTVNSAWNALGNGNGLNGTVNTITVSGTDVYVGGGFSTAGGISATRIARWDGSAWSALGPGFNNTVNTIAIDGTNVYAGGLFTSVPGGTSNSLSRIARWDGSTWSDPGIKVNNNVNKITINGEGADKVLNITGTFTGILNTTISISGAIFNINSGAINSIGPSFSPSFISRIATTTDGNVYVSGTFTFIGMTSASRIARWNGSAWSALGTGLNGTANAITVSGTDVYVGGLFTTAGGITVNRIARWDTVNSAWNELGTGLNGTANVITVSGTDVYVGGNFTTAGGITVNRIARWDTLNSTWNELGTGLNGTVNAIGVIGTDVYVGGSFNNADGITVNNIARWDTVNSTWHALGNGLNGTVNTIAISGTDVYFGGIFVTGFGIESNRIARWNTVNSTWHALGNGLNGTVNAIAIRGTDVYVGGMFTSVNLGPANSLNRIARWNTSTSTWHAVDNGLNNNVTSIATTENNIFVAGDFTYDYTGTVQLHTIAMA